MATTARALFAVCMLLAGCNVVSTSSSAGGDGGGAPTDGGASTTADGGAGGATASTCAGILDCAGKCAANDTACADACLAAGSPAGKDAVVNLSNCNTQNACTDSACLQSKCTKELQACLQSGTSGGQPLDGSAPTTGSVPAELVGQWHGFGILYEFLADGSTTRTTSVSTGGCASTGFEKGTSVVSGSTLTIYFTSGTFSVCNSPSTDPYTPTVEPFTYRVQTVDVGIILKLSRQDCKYTDQPSIDLYCTDGFDKK
jgi:hypothetical protein